MKAYKIELLIIDHDKIGADDIINVLENTRYPSRCISPKVKNIIEKDIGEWYDDHPFNFRDSEDKEYKRLFNEQHIP